MHNFLCIDQCALWHLHGPHPNNTLWQQQSSDHINTTECHSVKPSKLSASACQSASKLLAQQGDREKLAERTIRTEAHNSAVSDGQCQTSSAECTKGTLYLREQYVTLRQALHFLRRPFHSPVSEPHSAQWCTCADRRAMVPTEGSPLRRCPVPQTRPCSSKTSTSCNTHNHFIHCLRALAACSESKYRSAPQAGR